MNHYFICIFSPEKIIHPVQPISKELAEQQLAHGLVLWRNKKYQQAEQTFSTLSEQNLTDDLHTLISLYTDHALAFNQNRHGGFMQPPSPLAENCTQKLLFVTSEIESLSQADYFRSRFAQDGRLKSLPICIFDVTWFDPMDIVCEKNEQQGGRIGCELLALAEKLKQVPFSHLVVFARQGKANVHNGIMFLDRMDTYDVFVHELAHFSGFIDEYPLTKELAKRVCIGVNAPNIVFKQAGQVDVDRQYWHAIGLPDNTKLFAARTCDKHSAQAYKASDQLTFMEYHDTGLIPAYYLNAWRRQLQNRPNQPSAHVNFAQLYEQSDNQSESQFWWAKYQQYLKTNSNKYSLY